MKVCMLAIGDELLSGEIIEKNANTLAKQLMDRGYRLGKVVVCSDHDILPQLEHLSKDYDLIVTSGGLGSTHDDLTKQRVAEFLGVSMQKDAKVKSDLESRFGNRLISIDEDSTVPSGMQVFPNRLSVAPALYSKEPGVFVLPGVPSEFTNHLEDYLDQILPKTGERWYSRKANFFSLSEGKIAPTLESLQEKYPDIEIGSYPKLRTLSVVMRGKADSQVAFDQMSLPIVEALFDGFPNAAFPSDLGLIEEAIHHELVSTGKTLALAESCSGGNMAARFTQFPGASEYLIGSMVVYSNEMKMKVLGVSEKTLEEKGAVSEEVAHEMAEGLHKLTNADVVISITGVAGPDGGTEEKPVGTIYGAIGIRGEGVFVGKIPMRPNLTREVNVLSSVSYLFGMLWRKLAYEVNPFDNE